MDDPTEGSAIRRETVKVAITRAYAKIAAAVPETNFLFVYLSRNGRHFMQATETTAGVWTVSDFTETDGGADYADTSFIADGTLKTLGIRLVLQIAPVPGESILDVFDFGTVLASYSLIGVGASALDVLGLDGATASAKAERTAASILDALQTQNIDATAARISPSSSVVGALATQNVAATAVKLEPLLAEDDEVITTEAGDDILAET